MLCGYSVTERFSRFEIDFLRYPINRPDSHWIGLSVLRFSQNWNLSNYERNTSIPSNWDKRSRGSWRIKTDRNLGSVLHHFIKLSKIMSQYLSPILFVTIVFASHQLTCLIYNFATNVLMSLYDAVTLISDYYGIVNCALTLLLFTIEGSRLEKQVNCFRVSIN